MKCVVTGAAGFIGSHLCDQLLKNGHEVIGIDIRPVTCPNLQSIIANLCTIDLKPLVTGADIIYHLAAKTGLSATIDDYIQSNIVATNRLLMVIPPTLKRFVFASTSSVYGYYACGNESLPLQPVSQYGITKLAAEQLCRIHCEKLNIPFTILRYFSVYGPGQRQDMGYYKFINNLLYNAPIEIYGDGKHVRGNTFIDSCVEATILAAERSPPNETYNVGGRESYALLEVLTKLEILANRVANIKHVGSRVGDQLFTLADSSRLFRHVGWEPHVSFDEGLALQYIWQSSEIAKAPHRP